MQELGLPQVIVLPDEVSDGVLLFRLAPSGQFYITDAGVWFSISEVPTLVDACRNEHKTITFVWTGDPHETIH